MISVPVGNETKTALATADNPSATVNPIAGAECKLKINQDNTVDGQCNQTGGQSVRGLQPLAFSIVCQGPPWPQADDPELW